MADLNKLEELWRRSLDLNVRYYGAVGRLTADYLKELASFISGGTATQPASGLSASPAAAAASPAPSQSTQAQTAGAMVLEGEAGGRVLGVFMVENHLGQAINAKVSTSPFTDDEGRTAQPLLAFEPETVALGPGEQTLVRVVAVIDETLEPGSRYLGQFTIPGLAGTRIPVVLRRRPPQGPEGQV